MKTQTDIALIADSGSTKTAWCLTTDPQHIIYTQGINPFQQDEEEIRAILQIELLPSLKTPEKIKAIHFYGAGCTPEKAPTVTQTLRQVVTSTANINVESDMLGAARGLCGRHPGIVAILGTGSNSCYYDGCILHTGIPALGYILGDEGSGAYIGKRLVGDILKKQLPDDVRQIFFEETKETQANIIQRVYRSPLPNRYLASLSPFCARHREHPAIHALIIDCFSQFFLRNICPMSNMESHISPSAWGDSASATSTINFVGSVAYHYQDELREMAVHYGFSVGRILQSPLEGLIQYHQTNA